MKSFKKYLAESKKQWDFKIKVAGPVTAEQEKMMKALLEKFQVSAFKKVSVTPIQELPLDFPKIKFAEVNIFECTVDYPATQEEVRDYLCNSMGITRDAMAVRRPGEPSERYQEPQEPREGALLTDSEYKEAPNHKFSDYYGEEYNTAFLKELNNVLKEKAKERGEKIPSEGKAKFNTDEPQDKLGPISGKNQAKRK
jgi:hypothetical protein